MLNIKYFFLLGNFLCFVSFLAMLSIILARRTLPFKLVVSAFRRKMLMDSLMARDTDKKEKGEKVMRAFARQISINKKHRGMNEGLNAILG